MMRVSDVVAIIDAVAPFGAAEAWDDVGLVLGDAGAEVSGVYVALDPSKEACRQARGLGADVLVTHHPLALEMPKALVAGDPVAERILEAARLGLTVVAAHTNADLVPELATGEMCEAFGIADPAPLLAAEGLRSFKLVVFVPEAAADAVAAAVAEAGAGRIGGYAECTFRSPGTGTFRPLEGASPHVGEVGRLERVEEVRLETIVPAARLAAVLTAMVEAHPYEEAAYDVYELKTSSGGGYGCVGMLDEDRALARVVEGARTFFGSEVWWPAGAPGAAAERDGGTDAAGLRVRRVAFMPGSAAAAARAAVAAHADVLVCGEMKYHEALDARSAGVEVMCVGHRPSETPIVRGLERILREGIAERGWGMPVFAEGR